MKAFTLHDGESDKLTDQLCEFLDPVKLSGHDWEGHNSGIYIHLSVRQNDTIIIGQDGGIRVQKYDEDVRIDPHTFPSIYIAMLMIEHDNGAHHVERLTGEPVDLDQFFVPASYGVPRIVRAEAALGKIESEEMEDFVIGDEAEHERMIREHVLDNPHLQDAHDLLNDWFNKDWDKPLSVNFTDKH